MLDGSELDGPPPLRRASTVEVATSPLAHHSTRLTRRASLDDLEQESCQLTPKIDHRIIVLNTEEVVIFFIEHNHPIKRNYLTETPRINRATT